MTFSEFLLDIKQEFQFLVIGGVLIAIIVLILFGWREKRFRKSAPMLMISVGILGTFLGIWIALVDFDSAPDKIQASIEALLEGMKIAFSTSVLGLFFGVLFRCFWYSSGSPPDTSIGEEKIIQELKGIKKAIVDGNSSMIFELNESRKENQEGFAKLDGLTHAIKDALINNLRELINQIRGIIDEKLNKLMDDLIQSINNTINTKLGEKLDEFNKSVDDLRKWQLEHKANMEILKSDLSQIIVGFRGVVSGVEAIKNDCEKIPPIMRDVASGITSIKDECKGIPETMESLERTVSNVQEKSDTILAEFSRVALCIATIKDNCAKIPSIMGDVASEITSIKDRCKGIPETMESLKNTVSSAQRQIDELNGKLEIYADMKEQARLAIFDIDNLMKKIDNYHKQALEAVKKHAEDYVKISVKTQEQNEKTIKSIGDVLAKQEELRNQWGENALAFAKECARFIDKAKNNK